MVHVQAKDIQGTVSGPIIKGHGSGLFPHKVKIPPVPSLEVIIASACHKKVLPTIAQNPVGKGGAKDLPDIKIFNGKVNVLAFLLVADILLVINNGTGVIQADHPIIVGDNEQIPDILEQSPIMEGDGQIRFLGVGD